MMAFNMTYSVPYMTYQMTPVVMSSASFAGAGLSSGMVGMPLTAGFPVPAAGLTAGLGGLPLGLGNSGLAAGLGGLPLGLGNSGLAAALGLTTPTGVVTPAAPSALEMQILRALLARSPGAAGDGNGGAAPPQTGPAADDLEGRLRRLNDGLTRVRQEFKTDLADTLSAVKNNMNQIQILEKRVKAAEDAAKKNRTEP
jgi:hypothetical protein